MKQIELVGGKEMATWNYGVMWKGIAKADPARPAQMFGDVVYSWGDFHQRSNALAADMLTAGLGNQAKVAHYLYNCPEYLEATFACTREYELSVRPRRDHVPV